MHLTKMSMISRRQESDQFGSGDMPAARGERTLNARQNVLIAIETVCLLLAFIFLILRLYTRAMISHSLGWDDYTCVIAMVFAIAFCVTMSQSLKLGLGAYMRDIMATGYDPWNMISYLMYIPAINIVKISILLLYLRIFSASKKFKASIWATLIFVVGLFISSGLSILFACRPVKKLFNPELDGSCVDIRMHVNVTSAIQILADFMILVLPLPMIWALKTSRKQKFAVSGIFATGLLVCIVSILRLAAFLTDNEEDPLKGQFDGVIWSVVEVTFAIICSCMPSLRPFFRRFAPWLRTIVSSKGTSKSSRSGNIIGSSGTGKRSEKHTTDGSYLELGRMGKNDTSITTDAPNMDEDGTAAPYKNSDSIVRTVGVEVASIRR